jgi:hypothetical protein
MEQRLKEMIVIFRPTNGNGLIPSSELDTLLTQLGFEFLT